MKTNAPSVVRLLLGLMFLVFGLNGFFHFIPQPPPPESAREYLQLMTGSYLLALVKLTEIVVGVMLLSNLWVPLALTILAPVTVNIVLFHATLEPLATLALPLVVVVMQVYLAWAYRDAFARLFEARRQPMKSPSTRARLSEELPA